MLKNSHSSLFTSLDALLAWEKKALLTGDFDELPAICQQKSHLLETLEGLPPEDRAALDQLHQAAHRNQELLESALAGIREVARRMAQLRKVRDSLDTYDANGNKSSLHIAKTDKLAKRA